MLWELRCSRDGFSVQAAAEKGRELPQWYLDEPEYLPGDEFYMKGFRDLHSCRSVGMSVGPIPWNVMVDYAERAGLDAEMTDAFIYVIREMDNAYLTWAEEQTKNG